MVIFSGIQPTGRKHLGNYIGAIRQYVEGQDRADPSIYCIVDLHATTVEYDPATLRERVYDTTAILMAAGLDPERCILFRQGDVQEHAELCWLLTSVTSIGELNRMHQFRDKSVAQRQLVSAGLLLYPVLQAADVLAYRAHEVPVGEDQREHLELMRDVARRFNERFGETLVVPEHRIPEVGARVRDLQEPERKMSTTGGSEQGTVLVLDDPAVVAKKFRRAVTDSGSEVVRAPDKPGRDEPDRDPRHRARRAAGGGRGRLRRAALRRPQDRRRRRGRRLAGAGARALRRAAPGRGGARGRARGGRGEGARDRLGDRRGRPRGDGRRAGPAAEPALIRRAGPYPARRVAPTAITRLELDLDVFAGPFDLLLSLILREELDLLEVELAEIVLAYLDHLEERDELDLESATEFLVLIAALLELKSRLMLPGEEIEELDELVPAEAAEELLERMLAYARFRGAGGYLTALREAEQAVLYRAAALPPELRRAPLEHAEQAYDPAVLGQALGGLLRTPPPIDVGHIASPRVALSARLGVLRGLLRRGSFSFDDAVRGEDRMTVAVTVFALLELYKRGEADWEQEEAFGPITVRPGELPTAAEAVA